MILQTLSRWNNNFNHKVLNWRTTIFSDTARDAKQLIRIRPYTHFLRTYVYSWALLPFLASVQRVLSVFLLTRDADQLIRMWPYAFFA